MIKLPKFDIVLKAWSWTGEQIDGRGAVVAVGKLISYPVCPIVTSCRSRYYCLALDELGKSRSWTGLAADTEDLIGRSRPSFCGAYHPSVQGCYSRRLS